MADKDNTLLIVAAVGVGAYLLLGNKGPGVPSALAQVQTNLQTGVTTLLQNTGIQQVPTTYGIGIPQPPPLGEAVQNYAALVAANPNLGNPGYQLQPAELNQYVSNYADIQQGVATWKGGLSPQNVQKHWSLYGVSQQRIFLPLVPPSGAPYIGPPAAPKSSGSGSGWLTALSVVGQVAVAVLGPNDPDPVLSDGEIEILVTSAALIKKILPYYLQVQPDLVASIENKIDGLLSQYS